MTSANFRRWAKVHRWSSLVCTLFLLVICISGLPLVFVDEILEAVQPAREAPPTVAGDTRDVGADRLIAASRARFPGQLVTNVSFDDDEPVAFIRMVPSFEAVKANPKVSHWLKFDVRTGEVVNTSEQFKRDSEAAALPRLTNQFVGLMLRLHIDWFAQLPGRLFLGVMALLFVVAIVSGVVLYGPFMKKLRFGTVRTERSSRLKWLDLHNLLGIVTMSWALVVGLTGAFNEAAGPLQQLWQRTDVREAWAPYQGQTPPEQAEMASVQQAFETARQALPGMTVRSLIFPRPDFGSAHHYWLWAHGSTPLTERLSTAVLVDARTGALTRVLEMPWYLRALQVSRPLHFGDYGGLPLKVLWAVLDVITIVILGSGLYLYVVRSKRERQRAAPDLPVLEGVRS
jgi:uncharacterized iron-regulated membrane protein